MGTTKQLGVSRPKKIWIDLDNTPHIPFFAPIMEELEQRGYSVFLTARDCFQVCALADLFHFQYLRVGRHYGRRTVMKALGTSFRALQLLPSIWREKPDIAVSHGSRSQLLAATLANLPSLVIFDYEFAKPLPGLNPTWAMVPEIIPDSAVQLTHCELLKYPGIKEDVYVPTFKPDPALKADLGLAEDSVIVTLRPPANEAHYHNPASETLLEAVIDKLSHTAKTKVVLLPRNEKQAAALRTSWPGLFSEGRLMIPDHAVDGLNLIWHSDLVISGGGTMNREAAALGVPVYSIFRGTIGAVDRYLESCGRLLLLENAEDVKNKLLVKRRTRTNNTETRTKRTLENIVERIITLTERKECGEPVQR